MDFCNQVRLGLPTVIFEIVPPNRRSSPDETDFLVSQAIKLYQEKKVDCFNIPEIREETYQGGRAGKLATKIEPRVLAQQIQRRLKDKHGVIVNRGVPFLPVPQQKKWLASTYQKFGVRNLVIVGGEKKPADYSGWSVVDAARFINQNHSPKKQKLDYFCGGICIPQRRNPNSEWDEPARLLTKAQAGIEFFISQVIFETRPVCRLLADYDRLCRQKGRRPKMIFLSFAPIFHLYDLDFLKKLQVSFDPEIEKKLNRAKSSLPSISLGLTKQLLSDILAFKRRQGLATPLGLNIEYLTRPNFNGGVAMIKPLKEILLAYSK